MTLFGRLARAIALLALILLPVTSLVPAAAGEAETAFLQSLTGSWRGSGTLTGGRERETVSCRMSISKSTRGRIKYSTRCNFPGANLSFTGTIAYNDSRRRYEAVMSSSGGGSGSAVGSRSGGGVVFSVKERTEDRDGNDVTVSTQVSFQRTRITITFSFLLHETGERVRATVPLRRS